MEPAFMEGASVRIDPFAYASRLPQRRDVVSLRAPSSPDRFELKRIIGLPGDSVSWRGSDVWVNGEPLDEPCARTAPPVPGESTHTLNLGPGEYFVAGDNRLYSQDSRAYGAVRDMEITGKVLAGHTHV